MGITAVKDGVSTFSLDYQYLNKGCCIHKCHLWKLLAKHHLWKLLAKHPGALILLQKVHHAGQPMPGEEQEDVVMTSTQCNLLNITCPLSGKPVIELADPVRRY